MSRGITLQYSPSSWDTPETDRIWDKTLQPKENILYPRSLEELRDDWRTAISDQKTTLQELSHLSGISRDDIIRAIKGQYATIEEADRISGALGFALKRYPAELRRSR